MAVFPHVLWSGLQAAPLLLDGMCQYVHNSRIALPFKGVCQKTNLIGLILPLSAIFSLKLTARGFTMNTPAK